MNIKNMISKFLFLILSAILISMLTLIVTAEEDAVGFTVSPIIPRSQSNDDLSYFDLDITTGSEEKISVIISNQSSLEKTMEMEIVAASTLSNGGINYSSNIENHDSLLYPLSDIAKIDENIVTLPSNSQLKIPITLTYPDNSFDGVILGSIRVKDITDRLEREENTSKSENNNDSITIHNEYEYVIPIILRGGNNEIAPDFELIDVHFDSYNYRAAIYTNILNLKPKIISDALYSAEILPHGSNSPIFKVEDFKVSFAPNSIFPYAFVDENGTGIPPGTYTYKGNLVYGSEIWTFEHDFIISEDIAKDINSEAVNQQQFSAKKQNPLWITILIVLLLVTLLVVSLLFVKEKRKRTRNK